jgi:uncharacterized membrane protein
MSVSCTLPEEKNLVVADVTPDTTVIQSSDSNAANRLAEPAPDLPKPKKIRNPQGIYQTVLPSEGRLEQTVAFYPDHSYTLEEKYSANKKDSIVLINGTWMPSDGFIWLYKDQVVRARYQWKGDTLAYYSPLSKKNFSMRQLNDILENPVWQKRKNSDLVFSGIGNEPFWNIEFNDKDTVSLLLSEWNQPLKLKVNSTTRSVDSTVFTAGNDSTHIAVTVYPYFCSDGMSDFVYRNKVKVKYNDQVLNGCGVLFR